MVEHITPILYAGVPFGLLIVLAVNIAAGVVPLSALPRAGLAVAVAWLALLWLLVRPDILIGGILLVPALLACLALFCLAVACLIQGLISLFKREARAPLALGIAVVLFASIPLGPLLMSTGDFEIRKPFREQVAWQFHRNGARPDANGYVRLPLGAEWLSKGGEVWVNTTEDETAVLFWDSQGVGDGSGDVFSTSGEFWPGWYGGAGDYGDVHGKWRSVAFE